MNTILASWCSNFIFGVQAGAYKISIRRSQLWLIICQLRIYYTFQRARARSMMYRHLSLTLSVRSANFAYSYQKAHVRIGGVMPRARRGHLLSVSCGEKHVPRQVMLHFWGRGVNNKRHERRTNLKTSIKFATCVPKTDAFLSPHIFFSVIYKTCCHFLFFKFQLFNVQKKAKNGLYETLLQNWLHSISIFAIQWNLIFLWLLLTKISWNLAAPVTETDWVPTIDQEFNGLLEIIIILFC